MLGGYEEGEILDFCGY